MKVIVTALRRYWALGRCFEAGETEAEIDESQLGELDAAKGGVKLEQVGLERGNFEQRSPAVLSYRIVEDLRASVASDPAAAGALADAPLREDATTAAAAPELAVAAGPTETPHEIAGEDSPHDGA